MQCNWTIDYKQMKGLELIPGVAFAFGSCCCEPTTCGQKSSQCKSHKKSKEEDMEKNKHITEKGHCFWENVTMTMRQITPTRKLDKIEGWAPPQLVLGLPSWTGMGLEEDSSCYTNLSESRDSTAVRWTARAKGKLAGIRRRSRGNLSETWEGFK
uniref:Uncharacterized protein n=1 Tax=Esox lucius TaxID=8010 RepID=A0AAY5L4X3_ESOLU